MDAGYEISVITPVYEGKDYISSCVENVISQNCSGCEHVIVDGGSKDGTVDVIKEYAEKHPHITWISEKDRGQSDAMNKGIELSKADIITFLNTDDFFEPGVLNKVLEKFKQLDEPALLVGNLNVLGEEDEVVEVNKPKRLGILDLLNGEPFPWNPAAYFYHKSLHKLIGGYDLDEDYELDLDFILRAVQKANVTYVDETYGNWRKIAGTKTFDLRSTREGRNKADANIKNVKKKYAMQLTPTQRLKLHLLKIPYPLRNIHKVPGFLHKKIKGV